MNRIRVSIGFLAIFAFLSKFAAAGEIHEVSKKGDLERAKSLLASNPELVNARDSYGKTPLHWACMGVHQDIVEYLVEKGADVNARDMNKVTPLHSLALRGHMKCIKFLIGKGADFKTKNIIGTQALIFAAMGGHQEAIQYFIKQGMNPKEGDQDKGTPLHYAAHHGRKNLVEWLIKKGAAVNAKNSNDLTPTDMAVDEGHQEVARILKSKGGKQTPIPDAEVVRLSDRIHRITFPFSGRPNTALYTGSKGVLLVDTGYRRTSRKLKTTTNRLAKGKIQYVLNTHQHHDHNGGNNIAGDKTVVVDLTNLEKLTSMGTVKKGTGSIKGRTGKKFDTYYTLHFNQEEIRIIPFPGVHSDADLLVHFVGSKVVHMGDLLISQSFPSVGPNVSEYLDFLDRAIDVFDQKTTFTGGHGGDLTMQGLKDYRKMLRTTAAMVKKGMKAGKSVEKMQKERLLMDYESFNVFIPFLSTDYWIDAISRSEKTAH